VQGLGAPTSERKRPAKTVKWMRGTGPGLCGGLENEKGENAGVLPLSVVRADDGPTIFRTQNSILPASWTTRGEESNPKKAP
jgi:hypothetical protein